MSLKLLANDGIDATGKSILENSGIKVITEKVEQSALIETINKENYVALTVRSATQVRKDLIDACPGLKVVARGGVGMDNIDVEYAQSKGIKIINTPAASSHSVAELCFAHMFSMSRFLHEANRKMPLEGIDKFDSLKKSFAKGVELNGKTLGIIGFGRIGQALAKIALGNGMQVLAFDPMVQEAMIHLEISGTSPIKIRIATTSLEKVITDSDFISVHVPGGKLIGENELNKMKKGVFLVNAARGGVIDEKALISALDSGKVAFAALDVFENEPKPSKEILIHPKISLSPHIGASTNEAQERIGIELAEKVIAALS